MPETEVQQSQKSFNSLPVLYTRDDSQPIQYNPIQEITQLWKTLSEEDTSSVYQQAALKTWNIFKKAITLVVFLFLLLAALIIWVWGIGFRSGLHFRTWIETKQPTLDELFLAFLKILLWPFERIFDWANSFIKDFFGWEIKFDSPEPESTSTTGEVVTVPASASSESSLTTESGKSI
ncbi:hypothetical protein [Dendronalium sp. ChiSLP03b]|uniref:hypothetical protein n=1 Tax=Dendronalium sp. ChiSLP03b TaxID=3075381 RepID=UPI002AD23434|nr:hypothetical protein [Dendronalium sp. ChiSLP03b]MDZ8203799.1 hypothetical protein [Dendronalium sp. ChiSLP03b]